MITSFKIANIITHVALIGILIIVIFFTVGIKIEKQVVVREIKYLIKKILDPISKVYPDIIAHKNEYLAKMVIDPDSPEVIKKIDDHNKELKMKTLKYILGLVFIALISVLVIAWKFSRVSDGKILSYKEFLLKLVKYNVLTLIFVAMVYIGFTYFIGHNFTYIDYNKINVEIIKTLIDIRGSDNLSQQDLLNSANTIINNNPELKDQINKKLQQQLQQQGQQLLQQQLQQQGQQLLQ
jgi:hypothetical protein